MLIRDERGRRLAASFAPLAACLSGFLIGNTPDPSLRLHGVIADAAHLASGYAVVFLWWFCLASFDQTFRPRGAVLGAGLAWLVIASADRGVLGRQIADKGLSWLLVAIGFGMIAHLVWRLIRDREGDLLEGATRGARSGRCPARWPTLRRAVQGGRLRNRLAPALLHNRPEWRDPGLRPMAAGVAAARRYHAADGQRQSRRPGA
jgi:hypothetical protein